MNTEKRVLALLNKVKEVKKSRQELSSKIEKTNSRNAIFNAKLNEFKKGKKASIVKTPKIKLGKVDELDYDYTSVEDELSRLSYFVDEYFDEQFDVARSAYMVLNDVFKNGSESFYTADDYANDKIKLEEIYDLAEQLGVDVLEVYPDWQNHIEAIESFNFYQEQFDAKEQEFDTYFG